MWDDKAIGHLSGKEERGNWRTTDWSYGLVNMIAL